MSSAEFRNLLEDGDVRGCRAYWAKCMPKDRQPKSDAEAETVMHMARTKAISVSFRKRAYSHRWLTERGLESLLPDDLKPRAERVYPVVKESVGLILAYSADFMKPAVEAVRGEMETAILDCYANGDTAPEIVKPRMFEAKRNAEMRLFGELAGVIKERAK